MCDTTRFFHDWSVISARESQRSKYSHEFGGVASHYGLDDSPFPVHLLYRINLEDPRLRGLIPRIQWLPLFNCFSFENESGSMAYQLHGDQKVETIFQSNTPIKVEGDAFPAADFPLSFPKRPIGLRKKKIDPTRIDHLEEYGSVFRIDHLSESDRNQFLVEFKRKWEADCYATWTGPAEELFYSYSGPCLQGTPNSRCPNSQCTNHDYRGRMNLLAIVPSAPVKNVCLWGDYSLEGIEIVYELCPECSTINVTNQWT